jgi:hypothetical protein
MSFNNHNCLIKTLYPLKKEKMKNSLISNWNLVRLLRLAIGMAIIVMAMVSRDVFLGAAGLFFAGMAVLNVSCCGMGGCAAPRSTPASGDNKKETSYEEVV